MKKVISITCCLIFTAMVYLLQGCNSSPVEEVFSKQWEIMSKEDRTKLEMYFKSEGFNDVSEYWALCYDEGADTTGRINPWLIPLKSLNTEINLYIDNSSSMKGFFESKNLSQLISVLSGIQQYYSDKTIKGFYVEKDLLKEYPFDSLTADLSSRKLTDYSDAIQLDGLIRRIAESYKLKSKSSKIIDFIITDGIPSGTNEEINPPGKKLKPEDRTFNIDQATTLQARIANALSGTKNIAASVYQFQSGFNGEYYYYNNTNKHKDWNKRPFYIIAIGDKNLVLDFAESENKGLELFKSINKVHFGSVDEKKICLTGAFLTGTTIVDPQLFEEADNDDSKIKIHPQLSLKGLPYFARTTSYIKKNAIITLDGKEFKDYISEGDFLTLNLKVEQNMKYKLNINIKNTTPSWVEASTCFNDKLISDLELKNKTFNLKFLVEGLKNGITGSKGDVTLYQHEFIIDTNIPEDD